MASKGDVQTCLRHSLLETCKTAQQFLNSFVSEKLPGIRAANNMSMQSKSATFMWQTLAKYEWISICKI